MKNYLGMLGLLVVTIVWGGGFVMSEIALGSLTPFQILTGRFLIGAVLLLPLSWKQLRKPAMTGVHPAIAEAKAGIILGFFLFAAFALQTIALQYTTPSKNAFLTATNVVFVPFIALVVYKKKVSRQGIIGAGMALAGAGVLSMNADFSMNLGDALTLLCAVCFAFQIFLTGEYVARFRVTVLNFFQMATAFICSLIGFLFQGGTAGLELQSDGIWSVIYLGAVSTAFCYVLQTASQKYVDETKAAIILSLEAVFGTVFSILILQEQITPRMVAGCVLILSAVLISEVKIKNFTEQAGKMC